MHVRPERHGDRDAVATVHRLAFGARGEVVASLVEALRAGDPDAVGLVAEDGADLGFRKPSLRIPDAAFQVHPLSAHEPWMTGTLVYAAAFWELDCVGLRDPEAVTPPDD